MRPSLFISAAFVAFSVVSFTACGDSTTVTGGGSCSSNETVVCTCDDGSTGIRECVSGILTGCSCNGESSGDAGGDDATGDVVSFDAAGDDVGDDASDAGEDTEPCNPELYWPDRDGDGQGDRRANPENTCNPQDGWVTTGNDCDDTDALVYDGAPELCDGIDNDCDISVDEEVERINQWIDEDGDGFGDPLTPPEVDCARLEGYAANNDDCDDTDELVNPDAIDDCDGFDTDCDGDVDDDAEFILYWPDADEDGYGDAESDPSEACAEPTGWVDNNEDCLDDDPDSNPDGEELCDLFDNDCDDVVDEGTDLIIAWRDVDGDGYGDEFSRAVYACELGEGFVENQLDCDDGDRDVNPDAVEVCNGEDDDCNGLDDDRAVDEGTFYADRDDDGFGDPRSPRFACGAPPNHVVNSDDCDDRRATSNPDGTETCNGFDDDCDGETDEGLRNACGTCGDAPTEVCGDFLDNDCDGTIDDGCTCDGRTNQPCYPGPPGTLGIGICRGGTADCSCPGGARFCSDGTWGACEGAILPAVETCNGVDDDCDGETDEGLRNRCGECGPEPAEICNGEDDDCDGLVDEGVTLTCGACRGSEPDEEICGNRLDDDCDGWVDEDCECDADLVPCYPGPADTRGVGACRDGERLCYGGTDSTTVCDGYVLPSIEICNDIDDDCDGVVDVGPDGCSVCGVAAETCNGVDDDCDGQIDEGLRNSCGDCIADVIPEETRGLAFCNGEDDDCDGFVDEGLINACGLCDESCYTDGWDSDDDFGDGDLDGVSPDDGLRLDTSTSSFADFWVANSTDDTVTRIDTRSGTVIGTYPVGVNAGINTDNPSRTAVDLDGNAWVANRAFSRQGSVTKILGGDCVTDCVLFNVPVGGINGVPRALAIDAEGYAWVGLFNENRIYRLHPDDGRIVNQYDIGMRTYGFAIDREGIIWIASIGSQGIGAFSIAERRMLGNWGVPSCSQPYGIAVDGDGNVWTGNWQCHGLIRLDRASFDAGARPPTIQRYYVGGMEGTRGVAVDGDGIIWVAASNSDRVGRFNPVTRTWLGTYAVCDVPTGVGVGIDGEVWAVCNANDRTHRLSPTGAYLGMVSVGDGPYSYSDMTGFQLRNFTSPRGYWREIFDCSFDNCSFDEASWSATIPPGATLTFRFRSSPDRVDWSAWSPQYASSPATISVPDGRYIQVEMEMTSGDDDASPVLTAFDIDWQRP